VKKKTGLNLKDLRISRQVLIKTTNRNNFNNGLPLKFEVVVKIIDRNSEILQGGASKQDLTIPGITINSKKRSEKA
jgi:hypothetical protein